MISVWKRLGGTIKSITMSKTKWYTAIRVIIFSVFYDVCDYLINIIVIVDYCASKKKKEKFFSSSRPYCFAIVRSVRGPLYTRRDFTSLPNNRCDNKLRTVLFYTIILDNRYTLLSCGSSSPRYPQPIICYPQGPRLWHSTLPATKTLKI